MTYTDIFKNPITKDQVAHAVRAIIKTNKPRTITIAIHLRIGHYKASTIMVLLEDAGVVGVGLNYHRTIKIKNTDAAINAALRQLKKGGKQ